ncbi:MAG: hypothetical protein ABSD75_32835 [Terriglobales bacterium]
MSTRAYTVAGNPPAKSLHWAAEQKRESAKGQVLNSNLHPTFARLTRVQVSLKQTKVDYRLEFDG